MRICFVAQPVTARVAYFNVVVVDDAKNKYFLWSFPRSRSSGPDSGLRVSGAGFEQHGLEFKVDTLGFGSWALG